MRCEYCAEKINENDLFCMNCGRRIVNPVPDHDKVPSAGIGNEFEEYSLDSSNGVLYDRESGRYVSFTPEKRKLSGRRYRFSQARVGSPANQVAGHLSIKHLSADENLIACPYCGNVYVPGEKYCINCGMPIEMKAQTDTSKGIPTSSLQDEFCRVMNRNSVTSFFMKYAVIFALYFPIFLLIGQVKEFKGFYDILNYFYIPMFYLYYVCLICLAAKRKYLQFSIAISLRMINSIIILFKDGDRMSSVFRMLIIAVVLVISVRAFILQMRSENTKKFYDVQTNVYCRKCGNPMSSDSLFCVSCGTKREV